MVCEVCGKSKRDLLLRPIECACHDRHVGLKSDENQVTKVIPGKAQNEYQNEWNNCKICGKGYKDFNSCGICSHCYRGA